MGLCGNCCAKKPTYTPAANAFAVIPLDNTKLVDRKELSFDTKNSQPGYAVVPISAKESYRLANMANAKKKIIPYNQEQLDQGVNQLGVVPMYVEQKPELKAVKPTTDLPD